MTRTDTAKELMANREEDEERYKGIKSNVWDGVIAQAKECWTNEKTLESGIVSFLKSLLKDCLDRNKIPIKSVLTFHKRELTDITNALKILEGLK